MKICDGHKEISFPKGECPLCAAMVEIERLELRLKNQKSTIENLELEIKDLRLLDKHKKKSF